MSRWRRQVLADSHIAAVTIALLLLWAIEGVFQSLWPYLTGIVQYIATAIAILGIPYGSFISLNHLRFLYSLVCLYVAAIDSTAAWILSRWVYKSGPIRALVNLRGERTRKLNAEV
jgi:hypothetical protein